MCKATPRLNIDFVSFTASFKRGLDTHVSLKRLQHRVLREVFVGTPSEITEYFLEMNSF